MHYGLYRDNSFESFSNEFLKQDFNAYIYGTYLKPWNWEWLVNPYYGTNDRMAEVYDRLMFHGATYADLKRNGLPLISVNATDIANGITFPFIQQCSALVGSDLTPFPVPRAGAASTGFPVLSTPITVVSYRDKGGGARPPSARAIDAAEVRDPLSRHAMIARNAERYMNPAATKY